MSKPEQNSWQPWRWPMEWFREEKFWRDVGTRTFAGMITAGILYAGALLLGYLGAPHIAGTVGYVVAVVAVLALVVFAASVLVSLPARARAGQHVAPWVGLVLLVVVVIGLIALLVATDLLD